MELREIRFDTLNGLFYFNDLVEKIIKEFQREGLDCKLYNFGQPFGESWSGRYFSLKRNDGSITIYPFFGILYEEEPSIIYFAFENKKGWCDNIYSEYKGKSRKGDFYDVQSTKSEIRFKLTSDKFAEFKESSKERQKEILNNFFNRMVDEISQYI